MFSDIIIIVLKNHNWRLDYYLQEKNPFYEVLFEKCEIIFYRNKNYSSIECYLRPNDERLKNKDFSLSEILKFKSIFLPDLLNNHSSVNEIKFLEQYISIIFEYLLNELKGDFKIFYKIDEHDRNLALIQNKLNQTFVFETEIYKKMLKGDNSWKDDLDKF
jgi:hypothetical protein